MAIGGAGSRQHWPDVHHAKAARPAHARPTRSSRDCVRNWPRSKAPPCFCRPRRTCPCRWPILKPSTSSRCKLRPPVLDHMGAEDARQTENPARTARCRDRPGDVSGTTLTLVVNRSSRALRADRQTWTTRSTMRSASGQIAQIFHASLDLPKSSWRCCPPCKGDVGTLDKMLLKSPTTGGRGATCPPSPNGRRRRQAAVGQPPGPVPRRHDQLQPRPRRRARSGDAAVARAERETCGCPRP